MIFCENCGEEIVGGKFVYSSDHNDGKKFCSKSCAEQYYRSSQTKSSPVSAQQQKQAWITFTIGIIIFVLIIGIIGGTLSWLFKRKTTKKNK